MTPDEKYGTSTSGFVRTPIVAKAAHTCLGTTGLRTC